MSLSQTNAAFKQAMESMTRKNIAQADFIRKMEAIQPAERLSIKLEITRS